MLTLLTATGCRPEAFEICELLLSRQTYKGRVTWVVVDDGEKPQKITLKRNNWDILQVRPTPFWSEGQNTQARNLLAGLKYIDKNERVVIWEDDDYYKPKYLEDVDKWLDEVDLAGEPMARYFNVSTGVGRQLNNKSHASLCSTAVKGRGLEQLRKSVATQEKFIDLHLWKHFTGRKKLFNTRHVVGIKGLPGRSGIGMGHTHLTGNSNGHILKEWIGQDADLYGIYHG